MRPQAERFVCDLSEKKSKEIQAPTVYNLWERNVRDKYKTWENEAIKADVLANQIPCAVLMTHLNIDYNIGAVLRIGNCLGIKVFYYGQKKWDKRAATGAYHYTPITHLANLEDVIRLKETYSFVALEQAKDSIELSKFDWFTKNNGKQSLIVIGEESCGLEGCPEILALAEHCVEIGMRGSIRSLNAASAFSMAAYDFSTKYAN